MTNHTTSGTPATPEDFMAALQQFGAGLTADAGQGANPYFAALAAFNTAVVAPVMAGPVPSGPLASGYVPAPAFAVGEAATAPPSGPLASGYVPAPAFVGYATNDLGQYRYANGVIADPSTGEVWYPPPSSGSDPANVPGSPQWLLKIQDSWNDKKAGQWRKTLAGQGYEVGETGGMGYDLLGALKLYHANRYNNAGKVQPLAPTAKITREMVEGAYDPVALKEQVKTWGQVPFGEDLDPRTAEFFADRTVELAVRLAKQNPDWTTEQVTAGADVRAQKEFIKTPGVKGAIQDLEDDEMDQSLRDDIVSISQIAGIR